MVVGLTRRTHHVRCLCSSKLLAAALKFLAIRVVSDLLLRKTNGMISSSEFKLDKRNECVHTVWRQLHLVATLIGTVQRFITITELAMMSPQLQVQKTFWYVE